MATALQSIPTQVDLDVETALAIQEEAVAISLLNALRMLPTPAARLKYLLGVTRLRQAELERAAGISAQVVSKLIHGRVEPFPKARLRLSIVFAEMIRPRDVAGYAVALQEAVWPERRPVLDEAELRQPKGPSSR